MIKGKLPYSGDFDIDHPSYYQSEKIEAIDVIEEFKLGFNLGNTIKYILRAGKKDDIVKDLSKALWYLEREISKKKVNEEEVQ